jgi:hypothetical protein
MKTDEEEAVLDSSMEEEEERDPADGDERAARRARREKSKEEDDLALLYGPEEYAGPETRARAAGSSAEESMDESGDQATECPPPQRTEEGGQPASGPLQPQPPPLPPPMPPPMPPLPLPADVKAAYKAKNILLVKKVEIKFVKAQPAINPSGAAGSSSDTGQNPSGCPVGTSTNPSGMEGLFGQPDNVNGAYKAVFATRQSCRVNPSLDGDGGLVHEKISVGSFANSNDNRPSLCHFRSLIERKQNISFSFDPLTMLCTSCPARGGHTVGGDEEGGGWWH